MEIEVKEMPEYRVAAAPHTGPYTGIGGAFEKLFGWAGPNGFIGPFSTMLGVYYDDPKTTDADDLKSAACLTIADRIALPEGIDRRTIAGGRYAVGRATVYNNEFSKAWDEMGAWLESNGEWCPSGAPCYEIYRNNAMVDPERKWIVDICIPVKESNA
ncbi:MAG: GyrI-like domain-containing protein [Phycisphaerales bacterium]